MSPADITAAARDWIGTPYHHQASLKGIGCDCLGLLRGIWREFLGDEPEKLPAYSPSWDEVNPQEHMLRVCHAYLRPVPLHCRDEGTVLVFRMVRGSVAKHCGIVVTDNRMVHALQGRGVVEVSLGPYWDQRVAGAFAFPGLDHG